MGGSTTIAASQRPAAVFSPTVVHSLMVFRYTDCTRLPPAMRGVMTQGSSQPSTRRDQALSSCGSGAVVELMTSHDAVELLVSRA